MPAVYARSTEIMADPARIEEGIAFIREEVWPSVRQLIGCAGISLLVDREQGRSVTTTSWQSPEAMHASAGVVVPLRGRAAEILGAGPPAVSEWEIVSMHRDHHTGAGTCVRAAWSRVAPAHLPAALAFYREELLHQIEALDGFVSASLLVDRATGRAVTSVAYDSRAALEATRDQADYLRARSTNEAGVEFLDVAEFELAFAHLHVPELV
jgi:hypothetical protein